MNVPRLVNAVSQLPAPSSKCSPCGCLPGLNLGFVRTREGIVKILEIVLGAACQNLLLHYAVTYSMSLGSSYNGFLTTCSSSVMTSFILLLTFIISSQSIHLIRQSQFEIIYNGIICFLYISSSCYLAFAVHTFLYPVYKITSIFQLYPEMSLTYSIGFAVGALHGYDAWLSYKRYH